MKMETAETKPEEKKEVKMVKRKKVVNKNIDLPVSQRVNGQLSYERLQAAVRIDLKIFSVSDMKHCRPRRRSA